MSHPQQAAGMDEFIRHAAEPAGEAPEDLVQAETRRADQDENVVAEAGEGRLTGGAAENEEDR